MSSNVFQRYLTKVLGELARTPLLECDVQSVLEIASRCALTPSLVCHARAFRELSGPESALAIHVQ